MYQYINTKRELICHSTYKRYMVFYNMIELYEGEIMKILKVDALGGDFAVDFIRFGKKEKYSTNTIYRTIDFVKTILNYAERKGIRTCVREIEIRRERQKKEIITLSEQE
ncbi:MAG: phage integrase SAM-like domain-containing protein, partial [Chryseobacterium taeanense]